ncbi:MAG: energy-coupled thiamine transporter ThiT [Lachnospiraceae bacterium]|nr:energy-coupled thiamine transporter ThiT [Lachnospiraceae bacterium]MBQ5485104.1 energy-coupled thiamine transporter ThiT [Lachnospiraceae bacterium]
MSTFLYQPKGEDYFLPTIWGYGALVVIMLVLLGGFFFITGKKRTMSTKQMAFSAVAIALATVASLLKLFELPMGGAVTLFSMLFVVLVGYWYGVGTGIVAAISYGILQMIIGPYIYNPVQPFFDYIFAFGALGLSGVFKDSKYGLVKGYILGVFGRFVFSFLSGVIFFANTSFGGFKGMLSAIIYSIVYNGSYLATEGAITVILLLLPPIRKAMVEVKSIALDERR